MQMYNEGEPKCEPELRELDGIVVVPPTASASAKTGSKTVTTATAMMPCLRLLYRRVLLRLWV